MQWDETKSFENSAIYRGWVALELARVDASIATYVGVQNGLALGVGELRLEAVEVAGERGEGHTGDSFCGWGACATARGDRMRASGAYGQRSS
jgi:hypothetical protein